MILTGDLDLRSIEQVDFPDDQYVKEVQEKKQIILHHTAGYDNAKGVFRWWQSNKERAATCCCIEDDGRVYQGYSSAYWAWHINVPARGNKLPDHFAHYKDLKTAILLEKHSIGVEICNWGQLLQSSDGQFHTYISTASRPITVPEEKVVEYPDLFRGYRYYERYTDAEIESLWRLLRYWCARYNIAKNYHPDMWDIFGVALAGNAGIFTHASFRSDKWDCHPQPELIEMLKAL